ncbi:ABC-F family ATP-binding cassette domain-containing protein [Bacillus thuringiensis]|jgi:ATP-binding cassette, subfamily F, member 3|uniref:ABC transporter ATP-binding protein n=7 Tax=Bacillus cereus group TaxID=86661 RepID=A0A9X7K1Q5_BACTU|nr:ABC transporter, ATP-binding protein [Bacillus thuringiensis serovar kurstaki str. HD73]AHX16600.1 ABC transporter ATP-binding protein [Bacillus bombysepticus str. Wang]AIM28506.1 ABC transporter, ATP-binding protein [Bacillus thuringiensis serovar kurstaki str. YBT-1520]AJA17552.1 ABC transporter ATP-binding protein [Bacillus thuringiensis serovar galleriae]AJK39117.1 heme ABC exporter, ATP-binding protein CcmA [Bacillus thuringiensis serovar kurstaki]AKJ59169.1 ABC transporter ATP-binding
MIEKYKHGKVKKLFEVKTLILLQVNALSKLYGAETILANIKLEVQTKDRIALVGRNGAGKSTLLKIIAGELSHDGGEIIKPKDVSIGYLAQNTGLETSLTIWDEMLTVFTHLQQMETKLRRLEQEMGKEENFSNEATYERLLADYDQLQLNYKDQGGYQYEADIRSILSGLGFPVETHQTTISTLSGGQKTRLALGKLLLTKPDLLILDEPTNHLDIETLTWLEQYLQGYPGAILIVSHDRYFLDKLVTQVYEISNKESRRFVGNYSKYLDLKSALYEQEMKRYEKQQDEIAKLEDFVQKNIARASTTKRAQSRRKQLDRMELLTRPLGDSKSASFHFDIEKQSGNDVLQVNDATIGYDENPIIEHVTMRLTRGDSVALVGPNGIGKSTLLKSIVNKLPLLNGDVSFGSNVSVGYYDQEQANLTSSKRVLNELWDEYPLQPEKEIRTILGNFLFTGDDVLKPVSSLSGGQKARLALAKLMMQKSNLLILDEPTNHLDLNSKEILENALIDYPGTLLFVSHDRYFINRVTTTVVELSTEGAQEYLGDYDYYVEKKNEMIERAELEQQESDIPVQKVVAQEKLNYLEEKERKKLERQRTRKIEELEQSILELEEEIATLEDQLCLPEIYADYEKASEITTKKQTLQEQLETCMAEWEELHV